MIKKFTRFQIGTFPLALLLSVLMVSCGGAKKGDDVIQFTNGGTGASGVLVDGKQEGKIRNDMVFTGAAGADIAFKNVVPSKRSNEVIAFAQNRPPVLVENVGWTKRLDSIPVAFPDEYGIEVKFWIVEGPFTTQRDRVLIEIGVMNSLFSDQRLGLQISSATIADATMDPEAGNFRTMGCGLASAIKTQIGFDASAINVYYVYSTGASLAFWCPSSRIIVMSRSTFSTTLAHEMGHAFRLGHVNDLLINFDNANLMFGGSPARAYLTEGQTFRAVVDPVSAVNREYNLRPGERTRSCGLSTSTEVDPCPPVQKRIWADGGFWPAN